MKYGLKPAALGIVVKREYAYKNIAGESAVKALIIDHCGVGLCVNSALRLIVSRGVKPIKAIDDAVVVTAGESLIYIDDEQYELLKGIIPIINLSICVSTALAIAKISTGLRPYVFSSDVKELGDYALIPVISGNGGFIDDSGLLKGNEPVPVIKRYTYEAKPSEESTLIVRFTGDSSGLIEEVNKVYAMGYGGDVVIEADALTVIKNRKALRRLAPAILGIAVRGFRDLCTLKVMDVNNTVNTYRCRQCWVDYVGIGQIKTCPRCGSRVIELTKDADKLRLINPEALLIKAQGELTHSRLARPIILPLSWFTRSR
ncbi:hypothetical protein [Caldivirga maquilingensis]|uniref:hypothetical protein n=1 Tax=Caldivirga maquilingensis TaxID=76887 RepID=UPI000A5E9BCA|nr:hypothetical protein [Caldivirga maquilingensis]